nr:hypothetical protein [Candidatus Gracilibacteria bacterium]
RVVAADFSANTTEHQIQIQSKANTDQASQYSVFAPEQVKFGESVQIGFTIPVTDFAKYAEFNLIARRTGASDQILWQNKTWKEGTNGYLNFLWVHPQAGEYQIILQSKSAEQWQSQAQSTVLVN